MGSIPPKTRVLPPGFDEQTFDAALTEIAQIVGKENISFDGRDGSLEGAQGQTHYGDVWPLGEEDQHSPGAAIRPQTVSELQQILKVANKYTLPLWTISRGKNLAWGPSLQYWKDLY
jgi:4-cresol dehydrogenase (hydroxylating) flavoprotein subunit